MLLFDFVVDLVEGFHELFFVMLLDEVALVIVLCEASQEGSELQPIVAVFDVFEQEVLCILFEDMEGKVDHEEVGDLFFKTNPHLLLHVRQSHQLLLVQHSYRGYRPHKLVLATETLALFLH